MNQEVKEPKKDVMKNGTHILTWKCKFAINSVVVLLFLFFVCEISAVVFFMMSERERNVSLAAGGKKQSKYVEFITPKLVEVLCVSHAAFRKKMQSGHLFIQPVEYIRVFLTLVNIFTVGFFFCFCIEILFFFFMF